MNLFDKVKSAAQQAAQQVQNTVHETVDSNKDVVIGSFQNASKKVQDVAHQTAEKTSQVYAQTKDQLGEWGEQLGQQKEVALESIGLKIKEMVRGLNLQEMIDSINKVGAENKIDVTPLTNFIEQLKHFSEDGTDESIK